MLFKTRKTSSHYRALKIHRPPLEGQQRLTLIVGISCRNLRGFIFMWTHVAQFILATRRASGCVSILPGLSSPFSMTLISYWSTPLELAQFVKTPAHVKWMKYLARHPESLRLFNETYAAPVSANFVMEARGYAEDLKTTTAENLEGRKE